MLLFHRNIFDSIIGVTVYIICDGRIWILDGSYVSALPSWTVCSAMQCNAQGDNIPSIGDDRESRQANVNES